GGGGGQSLRVATVVWLRRHVPRRSAFQRSRLVAHRSPVLAEIVRRRRRPKLALAKLLQRHLAARLALSLFLALVDGRVLPCATTAAARRGIGLAPTTENLLGHRI